MFDAGSGSWEAGAAATVYATDNGATITNNSWGDTAAGPQVFDDARDYATANDVLQVAAAGNQGNTNHFWPAVYDDFLSVASTNSGDGLSWFSSHGDWIDMSAPGEGIWNLWVNGGAASLSGTSMASPHVAGAATLVRTVNPQLDALEARLALRLNGDDLGAPGFDTDFGHGRLDVSKAVAAAGSISLSKQLASRPDTVDILLHAPSEAGMYHVVLAGLSGNEPGIELAEYDPADVRRFPVNEDFLLGLIAADPFFPLLPNWFDLLDANGDATLTFSVLKGKFFKDQRVAIAFCTLDPADLSKIRFVSAAVHFDVQ
jgi:subtilisin family serine protease